MPALPPASGFFSKEGVAVSVLDRPALLVAVLATTFITAVYAARLYTLVFLGRPRSSVAAGAHESGPIML